MTVLQDASKSATSAKEASTLRGILVHAEGNPDASPRLHVAVDLARKFDATLVGVGVEMIQIYSDPYGLGGGEWVVQLQHIVEDDLKLAEATFQAKSAGLKTEWIAMETFPVQAMARHARSADLIVAGGAPEKGEDRFRAAHTAELIMQCGRPVFVAPAAPGRFHGRAVVVAWKDTRESRRALADSLPFLKAADDVLILECCDKDSLVQARASTAEVVKHLQRHGVEAKSKAVVAPRAQVAAELNAAAREIGADLIVAGAYGHSRLGEWALGGVTYDLLHSPERFVLLSH